MVKAPRLQQQFFHLYERPFMAGRKFDLREVQTSLRFLGLTTIFVGSYFVSSATPGTGDVPCLALLW